MPKSDGLGKSSLEIAADGDRFRRSTGAIRRGRARACAAIGLERRGISGRASCAQRPDIRRGCVATSIHFSARFDAHGAVLGLGARPLIHRASFIGPPPVLKEGRATAPAWGQLRGHVGTKRPGHASRYKKRPGHCRACSGRRVYGGNPRRGPREPPWNFGTPVPGIVCGNKACNAAPAVFGSAAAIRQGRESKFSRARIMPLSSKSPRHPAALLGPGFLPPPPLPIGLPRQAHGRRAPIAPARSSPYDRNSGATVMPLRRVSAGHAGAPDLRSIGRRRGIRGPPRRQTVFIEIVAAAEHFPVGGAGDSRQAVAGSRDLR